MNANLGQSYLTCPTPPSVDLGAQLNDMGSTKVVREFSGRLSLRKD